MAKDKSRCRQCQLRPIEYRTSITGAPVKHGLCRQCYELVAARHPGTGGNLDKTRRTQDMKENEYETRHGRD